MRHVTKFGAEGGDLMIARVSGSSVANVDGDYDYYDEIAGLAHYWRPGYDGHIFFSGMEWRIAPLPDNSSAYWYSHASDQGNDPPAGQWVGTQSQYGWATVEMVGDPPPQELFSAWSDDASILLTQQIQFETGKVSGLVLSQIGNHVFADWNAYGGADGYEIAWKIATDAEFGAAVRVTQTNWSSVIDGAAFSVGVLYTFRVRAFHAV